MKKVNLCSLREPILESFKSFYSRTGRPPSESHITISNGFPCSPIIVKKIFGSINEARLSSGLTGVRPIIGTIKFTCLHCHKEFLRRASQQKSEKSFCSRSCSAEFYNGPKKRKNYCSSCGKEIEPKLKTCSSDCLMEHRIKQSSERHNSFIQRWKNKEVDGNSGELVKIQIRRYLFEKYENKCSKCGWNKINPITGKIPLTVEHIDGNSQNSYEENLTLICPNCHSLTPTYGSLNRGSGRKTRKDKREQSQEVAS